MQDEEALMGEIGEYWRHFWSNIEMLRFSSLSKDNFYILNSICKYQSGKKDVNILNQFINEEGIVISAQEQISSILVEVLENIQYSDKFKQYTSALPFPELPELYNAQVQQLFSSLSSGKALSFDLFADTVLRDKETVKKMSVILKDLWL